MRQNKILIGCDPAFRKKGFCLCLIDESKEVRFITFNKFIDFIGWVQNEMPENSHVAIENSYLQNSTFDMSGTKEVVARKSRNVGKNQAVSQIAYELFCEYAKVVKNISPQRKGTKLKDDSTILMIANSKGYKFTKKRFNQDERDAFKLTLFI